MEPRISLITLGVDDLDRAAAFYEALEWSGQRVEDIVFIQAGPMAVGLWSRARLAEDAGFGDAGLEDAGTRGFDGVVLAQNVRSRDEVDAIIVLAEQAGATIMKPPAETFYGGYAGVFCDPDGHAWEIAHNPGFELTPDGSLVLPDFSAE